MKKITIAAIAVLFVLACGTAYFSQYFTGAAQRVARTQWEYLSIVSVYSVKPTQDRVNLILGVAEVCIVKPTGCGRFDVKFELDYGVFLQERGWAENLESRKQASFKASEIAFQKALYQLGTEGWEIVSDPALDFETVDFDEFNKTENKSFLFNRKDNKAVYFKRIKP